MNSILYSAASALDTFSKGWQVIANNVANVNTDGFKYSRAHYQSGPGGQGVQLGEIVESLSPGPPLPGIPLEVDGDYVNWISQARTEANAEAATAESAVSLRALESAAAQAADDVRALEARASSNVEIERELTQSMITQNSFEANTVALSTYDDMLGTVIDMVV